MSYLKHVLLSTQITAVKVSEKTVLIGEGQFLHFHNLSSGERLESIQVFRAAAVHGIQISAHPGSCSDFWKILVWGQKSFAVVSFSPLEKICQLLVEEKSIEDWIIDAAWENDSACVVIATAHNSLLRCRVPALIVNASIADKGGSAISSDQQILKEYEISAKEQCEENSILYCGRIVVGSGSWETASLLAGTVFSQVLIWGPWGKKNPSGRVCPAHRLSGHQGVLFSINFCSAKSVITTTSDDRSLRVWNVHKHKVNSDSQETHWSHCDIVEKFKCYGHGSRVWQSLILPTCFVSVGEDSKVCVWDDSGVLLTSWKAHDGSCIWCVAASEINDKIVTGGGDGSVKSWCLKLNDLEKGEPLCELPQSEGSFIMLNEHIEYNCLDSISVKQAAEVKEYAKNNKSEGHSVSEKESFICFDSEHHNRKGASPGKPKKNKIIASKAEDFPRCVSLLGSNRCLVMMDSGKLYSFDLKASSWSLVYEDKRMKSYAVLESSPNHDLVAVGTLCGDLVIFGIDSSSQCVKVVVEGKVASSKVFAILWLNEQKILTCGSEGIMITWDINFLEDAFQKGNTHVLPACRQRWVSAACLFTTSGKSHLVCGDRAGGIHLYSHYSPEAQHSLRSIHGRNGVTSLSNYRGYVYSTGRDGCVRCITVLDECLQVVTVTRVSNVNWVASLMYLYGRPLAVCFHDIKLKLWSLEEDRAVVELECGGGHRSWAVQASEQGNLLTCVYIKDTKPYSFQTTLKDKLMPLIKTPVNTRETMCLQILFQVNGTTVFSTGGEDTTIRLHIVEKEKVNTLNVIRSHISNVRAMCCIDCISGDNGNENTIWMLSAGGRAQMKVWKATHSLTTVYGEEKAQPSDIGCREVTTHMLRTGSSKTWKSQEMTFDPETRYMDVTACWVSEMQALVILASSDGFLRFFTFNSQQEKIKLLCSKAWSHCLLKVKRLHVNQQCILVSAATDGFLVFWNIQPLINWIHKHEENQPVPEPVQLTSMKAHQSGINSIATCLKAESKTDNSCNFIIASGGDDNKISIWEVTVDISDVGRPAISATHVCDAYGHASQITGLAWLTEDQLVSTSIDQRVTVWKVKHRKQLVLSKDQTELSSIPKSNCNKTDSSENLSEQKQEKLKGVSLARLESITSNFTGVADVKGLGIVNSIPGHSPSITQAIPSDCSPCMKRILIYGVGLQVYDVELHAT